MVILYVKDFLISVLLSLFYYGLFFSLSSTGLREDFSGVGLVLLIPLFVFVLFPVLLTTKNYFLNKEISPVRKITKKFSLISAILFLCLPVIYLIVWILNHSEDSNFVNLFGIIAIIFWAVSAFLIFSLVSFLSSVISFYTNKKSLRLILSIVLLVLNAFIYFLLINNTVLISFDI